MRLAQTALGLHRPLSVTLATIFVAVAHAGAPLTWIFTLHWHDPVAIIIFFAFSFILFLIVWALYYGRNWARWFIVMSTLVGILTVPPLLHEFIVSVASVRSLVQLMLYIAASILLLTRLAPLVLTPCEGCLKPYAIR